MIQKHNKLLLALLASVLIAEAVFTGLIPMSKGWLFTLLGNKTGPIWTAIFVYFLNYFAIDLFQSLKGFVVLKVALWYRTLRTTVIATNVITQEEATNIPQRIQEDIKLSYLQRITVWCEYFVSGAILVQLLIMNLHVPLLVIGALTYAGFSVFVAVKFNPRLTKAEIVSQQQEASFRTSLVESVTDITGLPKANNALMMAARIRLEYLMFTKVQLGLVAILPYIVLLPQLMSGAIDLGTLVAHQTMFGLIVINAAVLIQLYPQWIQGVASEQRVQEITK